MKDEPIVRIRHGRRIEIQPQVLRWRKRMQRYNALKKDLLSRLSNAGWEPEQVRQWLDTPVPELNNRPPRKLLNPVSIKVLHDWVKNSVA